MALIDTVFALCRDHLVGTGWDRLLKTVAGLKIDQPSAAALAKELARPLASVNRTMPGFEDFAADGTRGIEPGLPAQSLLYHALACPNVRNADDGSRLKYFPTLKNLEDVENYIFGVQPPTIDQLLAHAGGGAKKLAIVVFAYEYRPAPQTTHGVHADMAFARTGIARVGNAPASYQGEMRGFHPESISDTFEICVSPARFGVFLAVQKPGNAKESRPMRFREDRRDGDAPDFVSDNSRNFWTPVHKLFVGKECIQDINIKSVDVQAMLINEKIYRIHKIGLSETSPNTDPPFRFTDGIADFSTDPSHGAGVLVPQHHPLVTEAREKLKPNGALVTFRVPKKSSEFDAFSPDSDNAPNATKNDGEFRSSPEYVHIRTEVANGTRIDLNGLDEKQLTQKVNAGGYDALHYVDFSGEGWIEAVVSGNDLVDHPKITRKPVPAYALVAAPDPFPSCDQRELTDWLEGLTIPEAVKAAVWNVPPDSLCDQRLPPNIQLTGNPFAPDDATVTAIVSMSNSAPTGTKINCAFASRHSHLPDDAAGVFAPGWDVSRDWTKRGGKIVWHLAGYGLGSPFPEDAKLCAALSTFWPAVAPDATREMEPVQGNQSGTVAPLTDQEIGQIGNLPWDGVSGPQVATENGQEFAEYESFRHVDYVLNALARKFTIRLTSRVDANEYINRVFAAALAYLSLGAARSNPPKPINAKGLSKERAKWKMLSFQVAVHGTPELELAKQQAGVALAGDVYRIDLYEATNPEPVPGNFRRVRCLISKRFFVFVDPKNREVALRERSDPTWQRGVFNV